MIDDASDWLRTGRAGDRLCSSQEKIGRHTRKPSGNRIPDAQLGRTASTEEPRIYVGRVRRIAEGKSGRAPLAGFVSAT